MSTSGNVDYSVARIVQGGREVQDLVQSLIPCVDIDSIPTGDGWSKVEWAHDGSKILDEVRAEFKKEFHRSQEITDIVDALVTTPNPSKKQYFLARTVQLVVFQKGWSYLGDDCIVLIPVVMSGTIEATLEERTSNRRTIFTFAQSSEVIITGGCSMWIPDNSKVVCVFLGIGIGKDKR